MPWSKRRHSSNIFNRHCHQDNRTENSAMNTEFSEDVIPLDGAVLHALDAFEAAEEERAFKRASA